MNILFISRDGDSLGLAMCTKQEGYPTTLHIDSEKAEECCVGSGLVDRTTYYKRLVRANGECVGANIDTLLTLTKPDVVIIDTLGLGKVADYLREKGVPTFGGSYWSDSLSTNREYSEEVCKRLQLPTLAQPIVLSVLWNGSTILSPFLLVNTSRFMTGELGKDVDSCGQLLLSSQYVSALKPLLQSIERLLKKVKFRGLLSIHLHPTNPPHFSSTPLFLPSILEVYKGSLTDLLISVASGKKWEGMVTNDYALAVLLSIPPYPYVIDVRKDVVLDGYNEYNSSHIHLIDACRPIENVTNANGDGRVGWVTARGRDVREARKRVYSTLANLRIEEAQYRVDLGSEVNVTDIVRGCKFKN